MQKGVGARAEELGVVGRRQRCERAGRREHEALRAVQHRDGVVVAVVVARRGGGRPSEPQVERGALRAACDERGLERVLGVEAGQLARVAHDLMHGRRISVHGVQPLLHSSRMLKKLL